MPTASEQDLRNAYGELGLETAASAAQIKRRYRELVRAHHPDRWPAGSADQAAATDRMRRVNAAYDLIADAPLKGQDAAAGGPRPASSGWERPMDAPPPRPPRRWSARDLERFQWPVGYVLLILVFMFVGFALGEDPSGAVPWRQAGFRALKLFIYILHVLY